MLLDDDVIYTTISVGSFELIGVDLPWGTDVDVCLVKYSISAFDLFSRMSWRIYVPIRACEFYLAWMFLWTMTVYG